MACVSFQILQGGAAVEFLAVIFFVLFFAVIAKNIGQWFKNENSPRLTVPAKIVDKQRKTHHHHSSGHHHHTHSYHVTFEVESGDWMEFKVIRSEYDTLFVGDRGRVHFQGTRYLGFERGLEDSNEAAI